MTLLVDFSDIDSTMINAVGGKALNLGIMSSARTAGTGRFLRDNRRVSPGGCRSAG